MERSAPELATYVRTPLAEAHVAHLSEIGEIVTFAPGDTLVAFGAPNEAFFYILDGEAAAYDEVSGTRYGERHARADAVHRRDELPDRRSRRS